MQAINRPGRHRGDAAGLRARARKTALQQLLRCPVPENSLAALAQPPCVHEQLPAEAFVFRVTWPRAILRILAARRLLGRVGEWLAGPLYRPSPLAEASVPDHVGGQCCE